MRQDRKSFTSDVDRQPFTLVGRLLVLFTLTLAVGGPFAYFYWLSDDLPSGSYPLLLFALPILIGAAIFFALATLVLRSMGIPVFKEQGSNRDEDEDDDPPATL
jgi:hypothetical protein